MPQMSTPVNMDFVQKTIHFCSSLEETITKNSSFPEIKVTDSELTVYCPINEVAGSITYSKVDDKLNYSTILSNQKIRISHYLLTYILLGKLNSNDIEIAISPYQGSNENTRRFGDRTKIQEEFSHRNSGMGGRPSQILHMNYGLLPSYSTLNLDKAFLSLEEFDTSQDAKAEKNCDDSLFTRTISTSLASWKSSKHSQKIALTIYNAYSSLAIDLQLIGAYYAFKKYLNYAAKPSEKTFYKNQMEALKKEFIKRYEQLYENTLKSVKEERIKIKEELNLDFFSFLTNIKTKLKTFMPKNTLEYEIYSYQIDTSRGINEIKWLIDDFDPEKARIPMPSPDRISEHFELAVDNYEKTFMYSRERILAEGLRETLKQSLEMNKSSDERKE
ncbi:Uncharacterised protein [Candidatus Tiddalikarchaeum anstoanum]|nr:Uncharacterised protein [Candidatus Tiddalikarchaeum anstoanum]